MSFLKDAINHIRQVSYGVHGKECSCKCDICGQDDKCNSHTKTFSSITKLWESVLCPKASGSSFYAQKCLIGKCSSCGPSQKLPVCPIEESSSAGMVTVKIFEDIQVGCTETGKKKKRKVSVNQGDAVQGTFGTV